MKGSWPSTDAVIFHVAQPVMSADSIPMGWVTGPIADPTLHNLFDRRLDDLMKCVETDESMKCVDADDLMNCVETDESMKCFVADESMKCVDTDDLMKCVDADESMVYRGVNPSGTCVMKMNR